MDIIVAVKPLMNDNLEIERINQAIARLKQLWQLLLKTNLPLLLKYHL